MFFSKLLIAVDDSVPSQHAIDIGLIVAQRDKCPVMFVVLLDPAILAQNYGFTSMCELAESVAQDILAGAMKRAQEAGVEATSQIFYHDACQGIIDLAAGEHCGMIVMGTHGRTGIARALTRSVAESVLRRTKTPLFVIRRPPIGHIYNRFVVPIVDDELGRIATAYAIDLARNFDSSLHFCIVANGSDARDAEGLLEDAKQLAMQSGVKAEAAIVPPRESVDQCILAHANGQEADAIVMASHGRDGFMRLVKGSVTEAVIRSSLIPVLVVR